MSNERCYRCYAVLSSTNSSKEHIIPNACGGWLKAKILCRSCNSTFGSDVDTALSNQNNDLANLLMIKRERGVPQPIWGKRTSSDEDISLETDGSPRMAKPTVKETVEGDQVTISISARDESEFRRILNGFKRKYAQLDVDAAIMSATRSQDYLDDMIHFEASVGNKEVFRAITKVAIGYFTSRNGPREYIAHLIPYVEGTTDQEVVWMHYPKEPIYEPSRAEVSHVLRVVGDPVQNILYAYVELFNTRCFIVRMNDNYDGKSLDKTYVYDVLVNLERDRSIPLRYTREQLIDLFVHKDARPFEEIRRRFHRVLSIAMERQEDSHREGLVERAIQQSLGKYPDGTTITPAMVDEAVKAIMEMITPWILHRLRPTTSKDA